VLSLVLVRATQFQTDRLILLLQWRLAVGTTPCPDGSHKPAPPFPARLALDDPVSTACCGPIGGTPRQSKLPVPLAAASRLGGCWNAMTAVCAGCRVRRKRANRFGKTAITQRAAAANSKPRRKSSANRGSKHRPCLRGCTSGPNHSSKTRCRHTLDTLGEITPPGGVPVSG
jgi:hypothetical protein